jgi:hypothetical protein
MEWDHFSLSERMEASSDPQGLGNGKISSVSILKDLAELDGGHFVGVGSLLGECSGRKGDFSSAGGFGIHRTYGMTHYAAISWESQRRIRSLCFAVLFPAGVS